MSIRRTIEHTLEGERHQVVILLDRSMASGMLPLLPSHSSRAHRSAAASKSAPTSAAKDRILSTAASSSSGLSSAAPTSSLTTNPSPLLG